jgi:hypothetical protein
MLKMSRGCCRKTQPTSFEGRRLRDKGIEIGKREIEDVPLVEAAPRHGDARSIAEPGEALLIGEVAGGAVQDTG